MIGRTRNLSCFPSSFDRGSHLTIRDFVHLDMRQNPTKPGSSPVSKFNWDGLNCCRTLCLNKEREGRFLRGILEILFILAFYSQDSEPVLRMLVFVGIC